MTMNAERQHQTLQQADLTQSKRSKSMVSFIDNRSTIKAQLRLIQSINQVTQMCKTDGGIVYREMREILMEAYETKDITKIVSLWNILLEWINIGVDREILILAVRLMPYSKDQLPDQPKLDKEFRLLLLLLCEMPEVEKFGSNIWTCLFKELDQQEMDLNIFINAANIFLQTETFEKAQTIITQTRDVRYDMRYIEKIDEYDKFMEGFFQEDINEQEKKINVLMKQKQADRDNKFLKEACKQLGNKYQKAIQGIELNNLFAESSLESVRKAQSILKSKLNAYIEANEQQIANKRQRKLSDMHQEIEIRKAGARKEYQQFLLNVNFHSDALKAFENSQRNFQMATTMLQFIDAMPNLRTYMFGTSAISKKRSLFQIPKEFFPLVAKLNDTIIIDIIKYEFGVKFLIQLFTFKVTEGSIISKILRLLPELTRYMTEESLIFLARLFTIQDISPFIVEIFRTCPFSFSQRAGFILGCISHFKTPNLLIEAFELLSLWKYNDQMLNNWLSHINFNFENSITLREALCLDRIQLYDRNANFTNWLLIVADLTASKDVTICMKTPWYKMPGNDCVTYESVYEVSLNGSLFCVHYHPKADKASVKHPHASKMHFKAESLGEVPVDYYTVREELKRFILPIEKWMV